MLSNIGSGNVAAINSCGLNQESAMYHLTIALQLEPSGVLKTVEEAIKFCKFELNEVKEWRNIMSNKTENNYNFEMSIETEKNLKFGGKKNEKRNNIMKFQEKNTVIKELFLPMNVIKHVVTLSLKNLFKYTGICNENFIDKNEKDFSGMIGFLSKIIKQTCTYEPTIKGNSYNDGSDDMIDVEKEEDMMEKEKVKHFDSLDASEKMKKVTNTTKVIENSYYFLFHYYCFCPYYYYYHYHYRCYYSYHYCCFDYYYHYYYYCY